MWVLEKSWCNIGALRLSQNIVDKTTISIRLWLFISLDLYEIVALATRIFISFIYDSIAFKWMPCLHRFANLLCEFYFAATSSAAVSLSRYEFSAQQLIKTRSNSVSIWYFTSRWYFWLLLFQCVVDIQQFLLDFMSFIIAVVNRICEGSIFSIWHIWFYYFVF